MIEFLEFLETPLLSVGATITVMLLMLAILAFALFDSRMCERKRDAHKSKSDEAGK